MLKKIDLAAEEKEERGTQRQNAGDDGVAEDAKGRQGGKQEEQDHKPRGNRSGHVHFHSPLEKR